MSNTIEASREGIASTSTSANTTNTQTLEQTIQEAVVQARTACEIKGKSSSDCAVAWDIVEELQAEKSHRQALAKPKTSLDQFCDRHPEAVECLIYDV